MLNHRLAVCYRYLVALSLSLATFFPFSTEATYQYEYTSNTITGEFFNYSPQIHTPFEGTLTVSFDSDNLLKGGEGLADISNFAMRFDGDNFDSAMSYPVNDPWMGDYYSAVFAVSSVDANGLPTDWGMSINFYYQPTGRYKSDTIWTSTGSDGVAGRYGIYNEYFGQSLNNPGTWTVTSPVPEPETYAMMFVGLGMIGFVGRRKQKGNQIEKILTPSYDLC